MKLKEDFPIRAAVVDWLSFTVPTENIPERNGVLEFWRSYFGGAVDREQGGMYFYDCAASVLGSGLMLWHTERVDMGVHVSLPASALAKLSSPVLDFIRMVDGFGAAFARIDVAIDTAGVHVQEVLESIECGELVSKSQMRLLVKKIGQPGMTIYVGAAASDRRVRIYDKAAEQEVSGVWTRCEVQLKKEHARTAVEHLLSGGQAVEVVASCLDFREVEGDSNVSRRLQCSWWAEWLDHAAGVVSFSLEKVDATVEGMRNWIETQVAPTLAFLTVIANGDIDWLSSAISVGYGKLQEWQIDRARVLSLG